MQTRTPHRYWFLPLVILLGLVPALRADDLAALSDEFDDPTTLKAWQRVFEVEKTGADQLQLIDIGRSAPGMLTVVPHTVVWYQDWRGPLVFKPVEGDFVVTTRLRVTGRQGRGAPRSNFSLAGLMVRTPRDITPQTWRPGGENYLFLSLGSADRPGSYQLEVKTTHNSKSDLAISDAAGDTALLRIARVGPHIVTLVRQGEQPWRVHRRYFRDDLPTTLQVGLTSYTDWNTCQHIQPRDHNTRVIRTGNPDLRAQADFIRFARPRVPDGLQGQNISDPGRVGDEHLLSFLGAAAD